MKLFGKVETSGGGANRKRGPYKVFLRGGPGNGMRFDLMRLPAKQTIDINGEHCIYTLRRSPIDTDLYTYHFKSKKKVR